jgi:hypothetical protein
VITDRFASFDEVKAEAYRLGALGPQVEVDSDGKSMLIRLMAATATFPIPKGSGAISAELSVKIDRFASEQFKLRPSPSGPAS